jgi:hypothetical protein
MMADLFVLTVWLGGALASSGGFWRSSFWPYYLGKQLVLMIEVKSDT